MISPKLLLKLLIDLLLVAGFVALLLWGRAHPDHPIGTFGLGAAVTALVLWRLVRRRL